MAQTSTPPPPAPPKAPAKASGPPDSGHYVLLSPHLIADALLPAGTEVGSGTPYRYPGVPSNQMQGLDDAGKAASDKLFQDLYGQKPPWDAPDWPQPFDAEAAAKVADEEAKTPAVSYSQALERGQKEFAGKPVSGPLVSPSPMPLAGDRSLTHGAALPNAMPPAPPAPPASPPVH